VVNLGAINALWATGIGGDVRLVWVWRGGPPPWLADACVDAAGSVAAFGESGEV